MRALWDLFREHIVHVAIVAVCPILAYLAMDHGRKGILAAIALLALVIGVYVGVRHPLWLYWGTAVAVGILPFGYFPGVHVPAYLPFALGAVLAALIHPTEQTKYSSMEIAVLVLVAASAVTVMVPGPTLAGLVEFTKWSMATLVTIALLRLSREHLARFGRIFVYTAAANALFGIFIVTLDPLQTSFRYLRIFGYGTGGDPNKELGRFFYTNGGASSRIRLGGTWIDPNAAGVCIFIALAMGVVLFEGWRRYTISAIFLIAIPLTLSRSAIATVIFGFLLVLIFHTMRARTRIIGLIALLAIPAVALTVPSIRTRIFSTLSSTDPGATDRASSLRDFPAVMSGHWLFGLGWGRPEFKNGALAFQLNYVSNAPLLTVYRGGLIAGIPFVAVLIVGVIMGYRAMRSPSFGAAAYGGLFVSACFVAFQLDHPVASLPQITLTFSLFLAFMVYVDQTRGAPPPVAPHREPELYPAPRDPAPRDPAPRRDTPTPGSRSVATLPPPAADDAAASAQY